MIMIKLMIMIIIIINKEHFFKSIFSHSLCDAVGVKFLVFFFLAF